MLKIKMPKKEYSNCDKKGFKFRYSGKICEDRHLKIFQFEYRKEELK
jgi:hypothetical protein